jgi:hypothetical protein
LRFVSIRAKIGNEVGRFYYSEGCVVKTFVSRIAGVSVSLMMVSGIAAANAEFGPEKAYGSECYALVSEYAGGMTSVAAAENMEASKQVATVASEFKQIMSASEQARSCYLKLMSADNSAADQDDLKVGAFKAGVIFEKAQAQFGGWIDNVSLILLSDVAPAAGAGTEANLEAEAQMESGMEMLIDSYMLLENAEALGEKMARLGNHGE